MIMRRIHFGAMLAALAASGCGGGSGSPSYGGGGTPAPSPPPPGAISAIDILGNRGAQSFSPNPASVRQGDAFVWRNTDSLAHHIVLNDGSLDSGVIAPGGSGPALRLATDGANYHCTIHPGMVGSINASSGQPPPCNGPYCPPS
jgi:plastocyanin